MTLVAAAAAATLASTAYLNARFGFSTDLANWRDDQAFSARLGQRIKSLGSKCTLWGIFDVVDESVEFLWFEGRSWSYGEIKREVLKFAQILSERGIGNGDLVAIFTSNSPEMVIALLAISRLGGIAPMINTNLRGDMFSHCLNVAAPKLIVSTPDLTQHVIGSLPHISINLTSFSKATPAASNEFESVNLLDTALEMYSGPIHPKTPADLAILIYTSGTTGKPKACAIRNMQCLITSTPLSQDIRKPKKYYPLRTYSVLPLFHGTAIFTGLCYSLGNSGALCLAKKFSASRFWKDVTDSQATRIIYVGELCRYLLAAAPSKYDRGHNCVVATGNGLRREIWEEFKARFGVPEIREFYRSTEGLAKFDNFGWTSFGAGRVGFTGPLRRRLETDTFLIKFDEESGEPQRDRRTGRCVRAKVNEPGEAIGRVKDIKLLTEYLGNTKATEEKLIRDVFVKGDCYHRMGDLLVCDGDGWVRFHDRIGDSFRWKGENVSAGEVRDLICELPEVQDAVIFGVRLTNYDGQAGGAVLTLKSQSQAEEELFMRELHAKLLTKGLPSYAFPRLVRTSPGIGTGVTFKQGTREEAKKPWHPMQQQNKQERLYWLDDKTYRPLDGDAWSSIERGAAKL